MDASLMVMWAISCVNLNSRIKIKARFRILWISKEGQFLVW